MEMELDPAPAPEAGSHKEPKDPKASWKRGAVVLADDDDSEVEPGPPSASGCAFRVFHVDMEMADAPPEFRQRPAYLQLAEEGATDIPPAPGCGLYYHNSTNQWHSIYGAASEKHTAPSWNATLRSERKAILLALVALWTWWCESSSSQPDHKYLAVLVKKLHDTDF
eukprot:Skav215478  [mRNA]  locus=scaffold165:98369:98869:+ [translate_table: standard]